MNHRWCSSIGLHPWLGVSNASLLVCVMLAFSVAGALIQATEKMPVAVFRQLWDVSSELVGL